MSKEVEEHLPKPIKNFIGAEKEADGKSKKIAIEKLNEARKRYFDTQKELLKDIDNEQDRIEMMSREDSSQHMNSCFEKVKHDSNFIFSLLTLLIMVFVGTINILPTGYIIENFPMTWKHLIMIIFIILNVILAGQLFKMKKLMDDLVNVNDNFTIAGLSKMYKRSKELDNLTNTTVEEGKKLIKEDPFIDK
jgi:hypothetical protein